MELVGRVQQKATNKMINGLKPLFYEQRPRDLEQFSPERRQLQGESYQYIQVSEDVHTEPESSL